MNSFVNRHSPLIVGLLLGTRLLSAQDRAPHDTLDRLAPVVLPPVNVSVTRGELSFSRAPNALAWVAKTDISRARPTWGLDEALATVPGVYTANRYNFSLDQRLAIRGLGSRSAFAVRGVKLFIDGIPQTLPDGQGQLTNLDLQLVDRIEVLRGASSSLYGNASGGVISFWTNPVASSPLAGELRVTAGSFDQGLERTWTKWQTASRFRVGAGSGLIHLSRLNYTGQRDHSAADLRYLNTRFHLPVSSAWSLVLSADVGDQPRADNPGALTAAELVADRDQAAQQNLNTQAGKDVSQVQVGVSARRDAPGSETVLSVFGLRRDLKNPQTFAYIDLDRQAWGARATIAKAMPLGRLAHRLAAGFDFQRLDDERVNYPNSGGSPDGVRTLHQRERVTEIGPFLQSSLELSAGAVLAAGLRYDRVAFHVEDLLITPTNPDDSGERIMDAVTGSLGASLTTGAVTLYGNLGSSFETPTTTELANRPDTAGGFNAGLEPQRAWSAEVGLRGGGHGGNGGTVVTWNVAAFAMDVRDMLVSFEVPGSPQRRFFRNAGRARHLGVETGIAARVGSSVDLHVAWTASRFRYVDFSVPGGSTGSYQLNGRPIPGIPEHWVRLIARARPGFLPRAWLELEQAYSASYLVDDTLATRAPSWTATHLRVGWEGRVGRTQLQPFVGINNLFDKEYVGSVVINAARGRYYEPAPGRNVYFGMSVEAGR
jgi:iron complex outermembrane receptor protein